jgi:opacity protein-like surface antigen
VVEMMMVRKLLGSATIAAMLATSATPALARPGYGWGHGGWGGGYGRNWRHHDGDGFGNFLLGAVIAGGIVAIASSAAKAKNGQNEGVVYGGSRDDAGARDSRDWSDAENAAADVCADGAEALASRRGINAKVDDIDYVDRDGEGYRVEGRLEGGRSFNCGVRNGELSYIQFDSRFAYR